VYAYLCIDCGSWYQCFSVWTVSCMRMCFRVHMHAYTYVCRYINMCIFSAVSVTCTLQVLWALVHRRVCMLHRCESKYWNKTLLQRANTPRYLRLDNTKEFTSQEMGDFCSEHNIILQPVATATNVFLIIVLCFASPLDKALDHQYSFLV